MKTLISAIVIATAIATPALADKTPVKPVDKPVYAECNAQMAALEAQIKMLKKELAILRQAEVRKPKPVDNYKKL